MVDDNSGYLYMGEEDAGIWRTSLQSATSSIDKLISVGEHLAADVEGLAIYVKNEKERFLVASSQGDDSYVVYQIDNGLTYSCLLYTSPSPRDLSTSRMPSSA